MAQIPVLKITIEDSTTGLTYVDSVHRLVGFNVDALEGAAQIRIGIYANETALQAGKQPIVYNGDARPFYIINLPPAQFAAVLGAAISTEEKALNLAPPAYTALRIITWLKTLDDTQCPFNYLNDATQILTEI